MFKDYQNFPKKSGIYKITTIHNGLFYIGSALSLWKRMKDHRNDLKRNDCHVSRLQNTFNKYGEDDFKVEFLQIENDIFGFNSPEHKQLIIDEEKFINTLKAEYNTILTPTSQVNNPATCIKIYQYQKNGDFIKEWKSSREVIRQLGIQPQNGLKGSNRSSGGYQWSYKKVKNIGLYKSNSGIKKKVCASNHKESKIFDSLTDCVEYFGGERNIYQNIAYAIKVGKSFKDWKIVYCK